MVQGTGSDVGKSLLVAGLARAYARRGLRVRPFKPQNMSNNAAVTADGGEIGRAQALQARAAGVASSVHMNPVLLKPTSDVGAQVVVQGKVHGNATARDYQALKPSLMPAVLDSFRQVGEEADLVLVEGAGSAAEVNLRDNDIANFGFALAAKVPVVLVGDIDRGGVIAAIVGTHTLLSDSERRLLKGYIINKFRGDAALFDGGIKAIEERTGLGCFGVVPFFAAARRLPQEDAMALDNRGHSFSKTPSGAFSKTPSGAFADTAAGAIKVAVPRLSRIANFDDLDPLMGEDDVVVEIIEPGSALPGDADLVLIPGSKATLADLRMIRLEGWDVDIAAHVRRGGSVVGLCGGYQMLGHRVSDPDGLEGASGDAVGLGLLDVETVLTDDKTLELTAAVEAETGEAVNGYEMHLGLTEGPDRARPWLTLADGRPEGARSADGRILGSYLHGIFAADDFRHAFLGKLRAGRAAGHGSFEARIEQTLDGLADHLEAHLDLDRLLAVAGGGS